MIIKGAKTIEEYKHMQAEKIQDWVNRNFSDGSVTWRMNGANAITVTDKTGDRMVIQLDEIE